MRSDRLLATLTPLEADLHSLVRGDTERGVYGETVAMPLAGDGGVLLNDGVPCVAVFGPLGGSARPNSAEILERVAV